MDKTPLIGLALSSGAARGLAHIGVLKALEENNIYPDLISGCSAGALIGAIYSCGINPRFLERFADEFDRKLWVDLAVPKRGFIKGDKIEEIVKLLTRERNIEDLNRKISIVATDLRTSKKYIFDKGPIYKAVRASISIPGIFVPVRIDDMILVDGALVDRVPDQVLKDMGAEMIIAVDVGFGEVKSKINHVFDIIMQSIDIMSKNSSSNKITYADIIIKPNVSHIKSMSFNKVEECVKIGYDSAMEKMNEIKGKIFAFNCDSEMCITI